MSTKLSILIILVCLKCGVNIDIDIVKTPFRFLLANGSKWTRTSLDKYWNWFKAGYSVLQRYFMHISFKIGLEVETYLWAITSTRCVQLFFTHELGQTSLVPNILNEIKTSSLPMSMWENSCCTVWFYELY